jgi:putative ABC transport system permease protein
MYRNQQRTGTIVAAFSVLAVVISALGLFGLAAFMAERRSKEIGVRKVLGASVAEIVAMLTKEFAKWILVANFIAWPLAFLYLRDWLQDFPYRVSINFGVFLYSGLAALLVATLAVGYQAFMAARANPIDAIRWE